MAHFAELDGENFVLRVLVVANSELLVNGVETEIKGLDFLESLFGHRRWKQTSYSNSFRGRYAGAGMWFNTEADRFESVEQETPEPQQINNEALQSYLASLV
jgi:hypothetical protein